MPGRAEITDCSTLEMMKLFKSSNPGAPLSSRMEREIQGHVDAVKALNAKYLNNPKSANPITGVGEATSGKNRKASVIIRAPPKPVRCE